MSPRPELAALAADLAAHLLRVEREVAAIEPLADRHMEGEAILWALGGHIQALYTGCEVILTRALERFEGPPAGPDSHVRLLQAAALDVPGVRPPVIRESTAAALDPYRAFRHFFRYAYGVALDWDRMAAQVHGARAVCEQVSLDVSAFCDFLRAAANA